MRNGLVGILSIVKEVITPVVLVSWALTSVVVALAGPFGTYEAFSLQWRLGYWSVITGAAIVIALSCRIFWRSILKGDPPWLEDLAVVGSMSVIYAPLVVAFNTAWFGPEINTGVDLVLALVLTFLIGMIVVLMRRSFQNGRPVGGESFDGATAPVQKRDRLLERIGAPLGVRIKRVSSDNHHIRILTTDDKEYRILMRLRDAVAEIDVEEGFCVHRSHWLALEHIKAIEQEQGREFVRMPCGGSVPVGPKYRVNLVETGLLSA